MLAQDFLISYPSPPEFPVQYEHHICHNNQKEFSYQNTKTHEKRPVTIEDIPEPGPLSQQVLAAISHHPEEHLTLAMDLEQQHYQASVVGMIDSGATGNFIHPVIVSDFGFVTTPKQIIRPLHTVDGSPIQGGSVTHEVRLRLDIDGHTEDISLDVANIRDNDIILGLPWLKRHNPIIDWEHHQVHFQSTSRSSPLRTTHRAEPHSQPNPADPTFHIGMIQVLEPEEFLKEVEENNGQFYALWEDNPLVATATTKDIPKETSEGPMPGLPERYQEFTDVFSKKDLDKLPPHRPYDLRINLKQDEFSNDMLPRPAKIYPVSPTELEILRTFPQVGIELVFPESLQDKLYVSFVVLFVIREYEDVVEIHDNELVHYILEDVVDEVLEAGRGVSEAETHDKGLE